MRYHLTANTTRFTRNWRRVVFPTVIAAIALTAAGGTMFAVGHHQKPPNLTTVASLQAALAKHYLLPTDEEPALATVTDASKLTTPFLKRAQNGDRILIYQKNSLAIIYRPSTDRIISVGPVSIDTPPTGIRK